MIAKALAAWIIVVALAGCGQPRTGVAIFYPTAIAPPADAGPHVTMRYLGNGGWVIQYDDAIVVTAPFFSNPRGLSVYLPGGSRTDVVDAELSGVDLSKATIMLVGHGHYDHAMDLPHILNTRAEHATLYGSTTVSHLLKTHIPPNANRPTPVVDVLPRAGQWVTPEKASVGETPGRTSVRFMPLRSDHAPHLLGFVKVVWWGKLTEDATSLPLTPWGWPEGETLAYLIDFRQGDNVVFRIYYQDAAAPPGIGAPNIAQIDGRRVDVAILCVAGFSQVQDSPGSILRRMGENGPRYVVGGHWEDFFSPFVGPAHVVAFGTSLEEFVRLAHEAVKAPVFVPVPKETLRFPVSP